MCITVVTEKECEHTLYTSEKNPEPIFVRVKSSTEYSADTAVFRAKHDGPVTRRSDDGTFWMGGSSCCCCCCDIVGAVAAATGGPGPLCSFTSITINSEDDAANCTYFRYARAAHTHKNARTRSRNFTQYGERRRQHRSRRNKL